MARTLDADQRRRDVSEAAWRVLVRDGLTELSVRKVAAEAQLAPSSLRYTFPTQASVREAAVGLLAQRLHERVDAAQRSETGRAGARAILMELLPLDAERRTEMEVTLSVLTLSLTDASIRDAYEHTHRAIHDVCARAVALVGGGTAQVELTHAVVDGLALHLLRHASRDDATWAITALDAHLAALAR